MTRALFAAALIAAIGCKSKTPPTGTGTGDGSGSAPAVDPLAPRALEPATYPAIADQWWKDAATHCPEGTHLRGGAPPDNRTASCAVRDSKTYEVRGPQTIFYESGGKLEEGWSQGGDRVGLWRGWYEDGKPRYEVTYVAGGGQTGAHKQWSPAGELVNDYTIDGGNGTVTWKHPEGGVSETGEVRGGLRAGTWKRFGQDGKLDSTTEYRAGKREGVLARFNDAGAKISESDYAGDQQHGGARSIDPASGQITSERIYERGKQVGMIYYQDGKPLVAPPARTECDTDAGLAKVLEARDGQGLDDRGSCVNRPRTFQSLIQVGSFANDRGCMARVALVKCKPRNVSSAEVLEMAGWSRANAANRELIAMDYLRQVHTTFGDSIRSEPDEPVIKSSPGGGVVITAWTVEPAGMTRERTRHKLELSFGPGGDLTSKTLETRRD